MLRVNYKENYGAVKMRDSKGKTYKVMIHSANALCAFILHTKDESGKPIHLLWTFYADLSHVRRIMKQNKGLALGDVVSIKLNTYYKEARDLILPFTKSGYRVACYYKEENKK